jgi:phosphoribosylformimino-5-aminoimidazole carboxamide ribonucleotide (ProFAR) isomerase
MNLFGYIDKYGYYSFDEVEFNEVDNLVFSALSYVSLDGYVSNNRFNKKTIKEVGDHFFKNYDKKAKYITAVKGGIKVLRNIKDTRRYGNLFLYNYSYIGDDIQQFSAITIEINKNLVYVSYEGTDQLISGWKEDFMMSYKFPILSQRRAIDYLNKHFLFNNKDIILGGHSKGGNLAMVAGMYANFWVKDRIINIYNNDGPGLRKKEIEGKYYKSIERKLIHIIPNYSMIGLLLRHSDNYISVRSLKKNIYAHDLLTWVVKDKKLERRELSTFSKILDDSIIKWLDKYDDEVREKFVEALFLVFERAGVFSLVDVLENKKLIIKLMMETKGIDKETVKIMKDFIAVFFKYFKDVKIDPLFVRGNKEN